MAGSGTTYTGAFTADAADRILDSARIVREFTGVFMRTTDARTLPENTGDDWSEVALEQLSAFAVTETQLLDNPQQIQNAAALNISPSSSVVHLIITDKVGRRLSKKVLGKIGSLAQNAIQRKKDEDYLTLFSSFTTTLSGTGTTLASGVIGAAARRITSNVTEPSNGSIHTVLHGFQIKDLQDEVVAGIGTYTVPTGITEDMYRKGFSGSLYGTNVWEDGNITVDATPDARGAVHAQEAVIFVQGSATKNETRRRPDIGDGADEMFVRDEYAFAERNAGVWAYGILSDATAPTS